MPGNHDIWVEDEDKRGDSLTIYQEYLPRRIVERHPQSANATVCQRTWLAGCEQYIVPLLRFTFFE